jgi:hypothetical protein
MEEKSAFITLLFQVMASESGLDAQDPSFMENYSAWKEKEQELIDKEQEEICQCCGQRIE